MRNRRRANHEEEISPKRALRRRARIRIRPPRTIGEGARSRVSVMA